MKNFLWALLALVYILAFGNGMALAAAIPVMSTLTLPSTTTAYTAGQFMATNSNGTLVSIPWFALQNVTTFTAITRGRLQINDTLASSWNGQTITIDLWSAAPTFTSGNGDRSTFNPATGTATHLGALSCTLGSIYGDGVEGECSVTVGNFISLDLNNGQQIYWTATAATGSGTVTASDVVSFTAEIVN